MTAGDRGDAEGDDMANGPWNKRSIHGYPMDEAISGLQKAIRRGKGDDAVFWASEANNSGFGAWAWRRLFVITSEDIGLAEPNAPAVVAGLYAISQVLLANQRRVPGAPTILPPLQLLQATWYLARCPKNRELADMACTLLIRAARGQTIAVPDVARDQHTSAGRAMGRGLAHFLDTGPDGARWIENAVEVEGDRWKRRFYDEWEPDADRPSKRTLV